MVILIAIHYEIYFCTFEISKQIISFTNFIKNYKISSSSTRISSTEPGFKIIL